MSCRMQEKILSYLPQWTSFTKQEEKNAAAEKTGLDVHLNSGSFFGSFVF